MAEIFSKDVDFKLKALGVYQVVFGLMGLGATILWAFTRGGLNSVLMMLALVPVLLYVYSMYCGILLFNRQFTGLKLSIFNQYFQLINFSIAGYAFKYLAGPMAAIGVDITQGYSLTFNVGAFSTWNIRIATHSDEIFVNLNFVAFVLIIFIDKLKKKIEQEQDEELLSIGEDVGKVES